MYELFSKDKAYTLPSGRIVLGDDMCKEDNYASLANGSWGVNVESGVLVSYNSLDDLREQYGVDESDDESAIARINQTKILLSRNRVRNQLIQSSLETAAKIAALSFTDEQALEVPDLYPVYEVDHAYKKDERFNYNGRLFKVNQAHTSAAQWVPGETGTESLYTCLEMAGDGYLVWTQPTGAHNAYNTGDIVHYPTADDPLYKSLIDGNTWSPDAYPQGWELYTES